MNTIGLILTQLLTGKDNKTHDLVKWGALLTILQALGLTLYEVILQHQPFNLQEFGVGMGAVFLSVSGALKVKETTEPTPENENNTTGDTQ